MSSDKDFYVMDYVTSILSNIFFVKERLKVMGKHLGLFDIVAKVVIEDVSEMTTISSPVGQYRL